MAAEIRFDGDEVDASRQQRSADIEAVLVQRCPGALGGPFRRRVGELNAKRDADARCRAGRDERSVLLDEEFERTSAGFRAGPAEQGPIARRNVRGGWLALGMGAREV